MSDAECADARNYLEASNRRSKRVDAILAGEYPTVLELLSGLPPLGGSLTQDIRATCTMALGKLPLNHAHRKALEDLREIPCTATIDIVWRLVHYGPLSDLVGEVRFHWYAALADSEGARESLTSYERSKREDLWSLCYEDGLWATFPIDPSDCEPLFQHEILTNGLFRTSRRSKKLAPWLRFATGENDASAVACEELRDTRQEADESEIDDARPLTDFVGMVVVPSLPAVHNTEKKQTYKSFSAVAGVSLPLVPTDLDGFQRVQAEWPHARDVIQALVSDLVPGRPVKFRPTLLVGNPGTGKTSLLQAIAAALSLPHVVYGCGSSADNAFGGTASRWASTNPSTPLELVRQRQVANALIILDELEKAGTGTNNGNLTHCLLPFLEQHTASSYHEPTLDHPVDLSAVNYLATANALTIPAPLLDRFRVLHMPDPGPRHVATLARRIVEDIALRRGQVGLIEPLLPDEIEVVTEAWQGGSIRRLRRAVEVAVDIRHRLETRQ